MRYWIGAFCPGTCGGTPTEGKWSADGLRVVHCPACDRVLAALGGGKAMLAPGIHGLIVNDDHPISGAVWAAWQRQLRDLVAAAQARREEQSAAAAACETTRAQLAAMKLRALAAHAAIWRATNATPEVALAALRDDGDVHEAVHAIIAVETESVSTPEEWRAHLERQDERIAYLEARLAERGGYR